MEDSLASAWRRQSEPEKEWEWERECECEWESDASGAEANAAAAPELALSGQSICDSFRACDRISAGRRASSVDAERSPTLQVEPD